MNDLAKKMLGSCPGVAVPRTPEESEKIELARRRNESAAGRWLYGYEQEQASLVCGFLRQSTLYQ